METKSAVDWLTVCNAVVLNASSYFLRLFVPRHHRTNIVMTADGEDPLVFHCTVCSGLIGGIIHARPLQNTSEQLLLLCQMDGIPDLAATLILMYPPGRLSGEWRIWQWDTTRKWRRRSSVCYFPIERSINKMIIYCKRRDPCETTFNRTSCHEKRCNLGKYPREQKLIMPDDRLARQIIA